MQSESGLLKWTGIVLMGLGALFGVLGIYFAGYAHSATWVETRATISSVTVRASVHTAGDAAQRGNLYYPQIRYDYTVAGKQHRSEKWMLRSEHKSYGERADAVRAAAQYRNGDPILAYYNRDDPSVAVLKPGATLVDYVSLLVGSLFGLTGWVLFRIRFHAEPGTQEASAA